MGYVLLRGKFQCVDGPCKGKKYVKGREYAEIPPGMEHRFKEAEEGVKPERGARSASKPRSDPKKNDASDDNLKTNARSGANPATQTAGKKEG